MKQLKKLIREEPILVLFIVTIIISVSFLAGQYEGYRKSNIYIRSQVVKIKAENEDLAKRKDSLMHNLKYEFIQVRR